MPQKKGRKHQPKYIFVSGGVLSALGKGVTSASISLLLKSRGYTVCPIKCENNLNVDFGTLNPIEHGDPFLCFDGLEADQDLGNYERFLDQEVGHDNFMTMGQLYMSVINRERRMGYDGEDVEPIPHIVDEIIDRIHQSAQKSQADFVIIELGGTVGEYENNNGLYYEAARVMAMCEPVANVHVTYVPVPPHIGEPKTKPAQFGLKHLMSMGIMPNFIIIRSELPIDDQRKYKFSLKFNIKPEDVFSNENLDDIHRVPLHLHQQKLDTRILEYFGIKDRKPAKLATWKQMLNRRVATKKKSTTIAIVGKYFGTGDSQLVDSYYALIEATKHGANYHHVNLTYKFINSERQETTLQQELKNVDGIIVPIGWGERGVEGKINGIEYAREHKIPYLGLCYGMQLACVEYARHVAKLKQAHTEEVNPKAKHQIIHSIPFDEKYQVIKGQGSSMRLGTFDCVLKPGTLAYQIYDQHKAFKPGAKGTVQERHRHRYEFNNDYREILQMHGLVISGVSPDDFFVEMIELPSEVHPFFLATQGHPEYKSSPINPHPVFIEFIRATLKGAK
jgi:CTP synthase